METTFLTDEQIFGDNALQIFKDYGMVCGGSDLSIVLGGSTRDRKTSDKQLTCYGWQFRDGNASCIIRFDGTKNFDYAFARDSSSRPVLPVSATSIIRPGEAKLTRKIGNIQVVEYGEYPQTVASIKVSNQLEKAFSKNQLKITGKKYTFDEERVGDNKKCFKPKEYVEYYNNDKRYIRAEARCSTNDLYSEKYHMLSTGQVTSEGGAYWIEVHPIEWLKDPSEVWVARQALFAGVQYDRLKSGERDFDKTDMKHYLDTYFSKEMQVGHDVTIPTALGPNTAAVITKRDLQRQRALEDPSQGL